MIKTGNFFMNSKYKNVLLLCGGGGQEHPISLISSDYIESHLKKMNLLNYEKLELKNNLLRDLPFEKIRKFDYVIPCIHGYPGETGDIQSVLNLLNIPYLGPDSNASQRCFDKITTKLWLNALKIPNTPFEFISSPKEIAEKKYLLEKWGHGVFVKASSQGSSVGCYQINNEKEWEEKIPLAFNFSPYVLAEKIVKGRELEIAVFEYQGKVHVTRPGEIIVDSDHFYDYDQKYSSSSKTQTLTEAINIKESDIEKLQFFAKKAFEGLKLKDLSRIDFFYQDSGEIYLNEINTFPGMTPISMFPKMMEAYGVPFSDYLKDRIQNFGQE